MSWETMYKPGTAVQVGIDLINFSRAAMQTPIMLHAKFASWELIVGLFLHNTFSLVLTSYDHASLIDVIDTHLHDVTMTRVKSEIRALNSRPRTALTLHATCMLLQLRHVGIHFHIKVIRAGLACETIHC